MEEAIRVTPTIRYEAQTKRRNHWSIDHIFNEEKRALIHVASKLEEDDDSLDAVKVVREKTNQHGYILSTVIYEKVAEGRPDKQMQVSGTLDSAPVFDTETAFYGIEHRLIINTVLREFLDRHIWTASEFLYTYGPQKRLEMTDNLQMQAIGLIASAQVKSHGGTLSDVQGHLATQYQDAMKKARKAENDDRVVNLNKDSLAEGIAKIGGSNGSFERRFLITTGVAMHMAKAGGWTRRMDLLISYQSDNLDSDGWYVIDSFMADVFAGNSALEDILGNQGSLGALLEELIRIATGRFEEKGHLPASLVALSNMIATGNMPQTVQQLANLVTQGLLGNQRLTRNEADKNVLKLQEIVGLVRLPDKKILGGAAMIRAVEERSRRQMEPEIQRMLEQTSDPVNRLKNLLSLEKRIFGAASRDVILEYIENLLSYPGTINKLLEGLGGKPTELLRKVNVIYQSVEKFHTESEKKVAALKVIDGITLEYMGYIKLFETLRKKSKDPVDLANRFLALARAGAFTPMQATELVRNEVMELLQNPKFAAIFTADAKDEDEKTKMLWDFRKDLEAAGLWAKN